MEQKIFTLSELAELLKDSINLLFREHLMIKAEINQKKLDKNGILYLSLIEKYPEKDRIKARFEAIIWPEILEKINKNFLFYTGKKFESIAENINIYALIKVTYHEFYGLKLEIIDIDPIYTLGEWEQRKNEIIKKLQEEGLINLNKEKKLPFIIQNIALLSSYQSAGAKDFIESLSSTNFSIKLTFFDIFVQGKKLENSIIEQLEKVKEGNFDVVVIARGGGSKAELSFFDSYTLAKYIANFPIPVITAIGHEIDTTIIDFIAHTKAMNPTDAAKNIIEHNQKSYEQIINVSQQIISKAIEIFNSNVNKFNYIYIKLLKTESIIKNKEYIFHNLCDKIKNSLLKIILKYQNDIINFFNTYKKAYEITHYKNHQKLISSSERLKGIFLNYKVQTTNKLEKLTSLINSKDPNNILKQGYTLTLKNNKIIKSKESLNLNDIIEVKFYDGKITSVVKNIE